MSTALRLVLTVLCLAGCAAPAASRGGFDSPDPASRLYAINRAGEQKDRSAIPRLIELLDSDDDAERMMAATALQRITGDRMGYNPYSSPAARRRATEAWRQAWHAGAFEGDRALATQ